MDIIWSQESMVALTWSPYQERKLKSYTTWISKNFTGTKMTKMGFAWVSTKSSAGMLWLLAWCLCGNPHSEKRCSSDLNCSCNSFLPIELPCPDSVWGLLPFVLYLVWSFLAVYSWRFVLFWRGNGAGRVDLGKREGRLNLWGLEGRKTVVSIHCMREEFIPI